MDEYAVQDENGNVDEELTSKLAVDAIVKGDLAMTRELFENIQAEMPPSDKTRINAEIEEFENRVRGITS